MGHAIPRHRPAVVLRSHFNKLGVLLAIALVAVVGLTVAVVTLAGDNDEVAGTSTAKPIESINHGYVNPSTGYPSAGLRPESPSTRYEGGPVSRYEGESKYFTVPPTGSTTPQTGSTTPQSGGSPEGTGGVKDYSKNSATGD
jgi:hypothetical protein